MWKKIIEGKYLVIAGYYFAGIVLAVILYQFVTESMRHQQLYFKALIETEMLKLIVTTMIGGLVGGFVFLLLTINNKNRNKKEERLWAIFVKNGSTLFIINIITFTLGGIVFKLVGHFLDVITTDAKTQSLFSAESLIEYAGMIVAMIIFAVFLTIGIKKRLYTLYGK
ncbi:MAG: hypothetical protein R6V52_03700 [Bacteroidales bacterium]